MSINEHLLLNLPPRELDLTQAASLDYGRPDKTAQVDQMRNALQEVIHSLTEATQTVIGNQTIYFNDKIKSLAETIQEALNDVDSRLTHLSREQGQTEQVLDSLIKLWLLGNNSQMNLEDHKEIINQFIRRGLPPADGAKNEQETAH